MNRTIHFLTGFGRSGTTVLRDILNQDPGILATPNDDIGRAYSNLRAHWNNSQELAAETYRSGAAIADEGIVGTFQGLLNGRYCAEQYQVPTLISKDWTWLNHIESLAWTHPDSKVIICVRNPFDCFASMYRELMKRPAALDPHETHHALCARYFEGRNLPQQGIKPGPMGGPMLQIEHLLERAGSRAQLERKFPNIIFVEYEKLCAAGAKEVQCLRWKLGLAIYDHDLENIEPSKLRELDALYRPGAEHAREAGPLRAVQKGNDWQEHVPPTLARVVAQAYPALFKEFGYAQ